MVSLVPEVSSDGEDGVAEAPRSSLVSRRLAGAGGQETGALIESEPALRVIDAHPAVCR